MFPCLSSVKYTMTAAVLKVTVTQDDISGGLKREWAQDRIVKCYARPVLPKMTGQEDIGQIYSNQEYVRMLVKQPISLGDRVTKITSNATGEYIWREDYVDPDIQEDANVPTIFNVQGCAPIIDPFGAVLEYEVILERLNK